MSEEFISSVAFLTAAAMVLAPLFIVVLHESGVRFRRPWQHADDCPCGPCIDKAVAREVGHLERKRRIMEVRKAIEELERDRKGHP